MRRLILFLLLLTPSQLNAAIGQGDWEKMAGGTGTALSGNLIVPSDGNRVVFIYVTFDAIANITSPTLEGVAMTSVDKKCIDSTSDVCLEVFRLTGAASGSSQTFAGTLSTSANWHVCGVTFHGVDQTTPVPAYFNASALSAGPATVNVTSVVSGQRVVAFVGCASDSNTLAPASGETEVQDNGNHGARSGGYYEDSTGTVTMSVTLGANDAWSIIAFALSPSTTTSIIQSHKHARSQ